MYNVLQVHRSSVTQYLLQVDRMCSAEAAITINQNKQKIKKNERVIVHCLIMAQRQWIVNILLKAAP